MRGCLAYLFIPLLLTASLSSASVTTECQRARQVGFYVERKPGTHFFLEAEEEMLALQSVDSLGQCTAICRQNADCSSASFVQPRDPILERPLCLLFGPKQSDSPSYRHQNSIHRMLPVVEAVLYTARKYCRPLDLDDVPPQPYDYELWRDFRMSSSFKVLAQLQQSSASSSDPVGCLNECNRERECAAAELDASRSACRLFQSAPAAAARNPDRAVVFKSGSLLFEKRVESSLPFDQLESGACVWQRRLTVDPPDTWEERAESLPDWKACASWCEHQLPHCRHWWHSKRDGICLLSHSSVTELDQFRHFDVPPSPVLMQDAPDGTVQSAQLDNCVHVWANCARHGVWLHASSLVAWRGEVRVVGCKRPAPRNASPSNESLEMSAFADYANCATVTNGGASYRTRFSLKHQPLHLVTARDRYVDIECRLSLQSPDILKNEDVELGYELLVLPKRSNDTRLASPIVVPSTTTRSSSSSTAPSSRPAYSLVVEESDVEEPVLRLVIRPDARQTKPYLLADVRSADGRHVLLDEQGCIPSHSVAKKIERTEDGGLLVQLDDAPLMLDKGGMTIEGVVRECDNSLQCLRKCRSRRAASSKPSGPPSLPVSLDAKSAAARLAAGNRRLSQTLHLVSVRLRKRSPPPRSSPPPKILPFTTTSPPVAFVAPTTTTTSPSSFSPPSSAALPASASLNHLESVDSLRPAMGGLLAASGAVGLVLVGAVIMALIRIR